MTADDQREGGDGSAARPATAPAETPFLFRAGGLRLIELQPTRRCNLRCRHCYSESGPGQDGFLDGAGLAAFVREAAALGYGYVGVSGGEPLLWPDLEPFLEAAVEAGLSTAIVTNGTLFTPARARRLGGLAGVIAVSVDGPPPEHDAFRGVPAAFARMREGLAILRGEGVPFVLVFTLTRTNAGRLDWLYGFADEVGAAAVEVHPLCSFGAAARNLPDAAPDTIEYRAAMVLLALLAQRRGEGGPAVFLDVVRCAVVEGSDWPLLPARAAMRGAARFADVVPSLVVEPDGCITPFIYGFPRRWAIGTVGGAPLAQAAGAWRARAEGPLADLVRATLDRLRGSGEELVDLFGQLLRTATDGTGRTGPLQ